MNAASFGLIAWTTPIRGPITFRKPPSAGPMRVGAGHAGAKLTFLEWLGATRGATNHKRVFLFCLHSDVMQCSSSATAQHGQ
jgi:hypothetical protein